MTTAHIIADTILQIAWGHNGIGFGLPLALAVVWYRRWGV